MKSLMTLAILASSLVASLATAAPSNCMQSCERNKKQCFAQYTQSDVRGNRYVTPDGHRICWGSYNSCKKNCPPPARR